MKIVLESEKQVFKYFEEQNSTLTKTSDLISRYKASLSVELEKPGSSNHLSNINSSQLSLVNLNKNQNRSKKLGSIMGIVKRSRSIQYTECPSNHIFLIFILKISYFLIRIIFLCLLIIYHAKKKIFNKSYLVNINAKRPSFTHIFIDPKSKLHISNLLKNFLLFTKYHLIHFNILILKHINQLYIKIF